MASAEALRHHATLHRQPDWESAIATTHIDCRGHTVAEEASDRCARHRRVRHRRVRRTCCNTTLEVQFWPQVDVQQGYAEGGGGDGEGEGHFLGIPLS